MNVTDAEQLAREILDTVEQPGELRGWLQHRSASASTEFLDKACVLATEELLSAEPPRTGEWEQLLIQLAVHSQETAAHAGLDRCKSVLAKLDEMIAADRFASVEHDKIVTIAGALTIALTAQRRLRQPIEKVMRSLCEKSDNELAQIGQQCQNIWTRKGQMSGEPGLFLWDTRNGEWRLRQDFKAHRPDR
jgi:hypothetical protein